MLHVYAFLTFSGKKDVDRYNVIMEDDNLCQTAASAFDLGQEISKSLPVNRKEDLVVDNVNMVVSILNRWIRS